MICYEQIFLFNGSHNHNNLRIRIINAVIHTVISLLAAYGGKALSNGEKALSKAAIKVIKLLEHECGLREIATFIQHSNLTKLRNGIMATLIESGFAELTQPNSPRSPTQKYRLTEKGRALYEKLSKE